MNRLLAPFAAIIVAAVALSATALPKRDLSSVARKIENVCGIAPGEALKVVGPAAIDVWPKHPRSMNYDRMRCLMDRLMPLGKEGVKVALVGQDSPAVKNH